MPASVGQGRFCRTMIAIPACFASLVLLGWLVGDYGLEHLWLSRVAMNPASAVALILLSMSMAMSMPGTVGHRRNVAMVLVGCAALIGALVLADDTVGTGFRPDRLLFMSQLAAPGEPPSHMAPNTAICLLLLCGGVMAAQNRTRGAALMAQVFALAAMTISGFAVIGHLYNVTVLYGLRSQFPMAAHTAAAFIAVSIYILSVTRHGPATLLADQGATGAMMRRLIPATLSLPVMVGALGLLIAERRAMPTEAVVAAMVVMNVVLLTTLVTITGFRLHAADIARRHAEIRLIQLARTDFLTGLPNRARFMEHLMQRMSATKRRAGNSFAVIYMDLDGFKSVNDTLGHGAGDRLLQDVAEHLRVCVRPDDIIARFGGDEFTMLLNHVDSVDDATRVASRIVENMPKTASSNGQTVPIGISVGLVVSESRHLTLEGVLRDADEALYRAKRNGRGQFILYTNPQGNLSRRSSQLAA